MSNNNLIKALARLTGIKNNIPAVWVLRKYADEFNSVLISIEKESEFNLAEFSIPASEFKTIAHYTGEYCDREFLLMKVDGLLSYFNFSLQPDETKNRLGFFYEEKKDN